MAALVDAAAFAIDPDARPPLTAAIVSAAVAIANEDPAAAHHAQRVALAFQVLKNPEQMVDQFAWAMATNSTVVGKWTAGDHDGAMGDFAFVIGSIWDALAGP